MQFDVTNATTWVPIVAGVIIPFVVAYLARAKASGNVKSLLAAVSAGLVALGLYLGDVAGAHSWQGAASVFVLALVTAAASRITLTDHVVAKVQAATPGIVG
jgi:hypothetical protein